MTIKLIKETIERCGNTIAQWDFRKCPYLRLPVLEELSWKTPIQAEPVTNLEMKIVKVYWEHGYINGMPAHRLVAELEGTEFKWIGTTRVE